MRRFCRRANASSRPNSGRPRAARQIRQQRRLHELGACTIWEPVRIGNLSELGACPPWRFRRAKHDLLIGLHNKSHTDIDLRYKDTPRGNRKENPQQKCLGKELVSCVRSFRLACPDLRSLFLTQLILYVEGEGTKTLTAVVTAGASAANAQAAIRWQ